MGKYKHEGKGRNISIGGGKERADLFKDMSGGYNAMGDSNKPSPVYNYGGNSAAKRYSQPMEKQGPLHGNAFGHAMQKTGGDYDKAKSMLNMMGDPNKKMDRLSAKHKSLYDRFEMGQTSEAEEQRMYKLEDRMDKVGKRINKKQSRGPLNQNPCPEGKAWDDERKGCYPSKKEEAKMKMKKNKEKPGLINRPDKKKSNLPRKKVE